MKSLRENQCVRPALFDRLLICKLKQVLIYSSDVYFKYPDRPRCPNEFNAYTFNSNGKYERIDSI